MLTTFTMLYLYSFVLALVLASATEIAVSNSTDVSDLESGKCQCFVVSGPDPGYFQNYRLYDFRSSNPGARSRDNPKFPPTTRDFSPEEPRNFAPVESPEKVPLTKGDWDSQAWRREGSRLFPVPIQNSPKNVFISQDEAAGTAGASYLTMRTMRHQDYSSTAEMVTTTKNFLHCSLRIRLRLFSGSERAHPTLGEDIEDADDSNVTTPFQPGDNFSAIQQRQAALPPQPGAVAGIFTYHSFTSESDIEILTSDPPNQVRYVNQPSYDPISEEVVPGAGTTVSNLPIPWTEWSTHRLDWLPGMSRWYVNNMEQATKTYGVPHDPSVLVLNLWSDGGVWSGNLTVGAAVHLGIEWIEIAYNTSDSDSVRLPADRGASGGVETTANANANFCMVGCRIDDPEDGNSVKNLGNPQIAWDNRPASEKKGVSFNPVVIGNPLIMTPKGSEDSADSEKNSEMQNDGGGGNTVHSRFGGTFAVVFAAVGVIATNFLLS